MAQNGLRGKLGVRLVDLPRPVVYAPAAVLWIGRIFGGLVGFVIAVIGTEVIFPNTNEKAPAALGVAAILIVVGVFAGARVALHFRKQP